MNDFPHQGRGCVLVIGRDPSNRTNSRFGPKGHEVEPLAPREAVDMLLRLTDKSKEPDAVSTAEKIIGVWSTFPLSLMCVAGKIDNDGLSLSECFAYGSRQRENLLNSTWYYATEEYDLASLWALSDLSLSALTVLQIVALLDVEDIPERLFQRLIRLSSGQEFSLEAVNESKTSLWKLALIRRHGYQSTLHASYHSTNGTRRSSYLQGTFR